MTLASMNNSSGTSYAQDASHASAPRKACEVCLKRIQWDQCLRDAKAVGDMTPEKVEACQRDLDDAGGRINELRELRALETKEWVDERGRWSKQVDERDATIESMHTTGDLAFWVGVAAFGGLLLGGGLVLVLK